MLNGLSGAIVDGEIAKGVILNGDPALVGFNGFFAWEKERAYGFTC